PDLGGTREQRVLTARPQTDLLELLSGPVRPAAAEPTGQLLHPVAEEVAADRGPQNQLPCARHEVRLPLSREGKPRARVRLDERFQPGRRARLAARRGSRA